MPIQFFGFRPWWNVARNYQKALVTAPLVLLGPIVAFWIGCAIHHVWTPFMLLGIPYGMLISIPVMRFGGHIQSAIAGFAGGITLGNIGAKQALVSSWIQAIAKAVLDLVQGALSVAVQTPPNNPCFAYAPMGIVYCIFFAILTVGVVVVLNLIFT
jgi:hypothetical protein